MNNLTMFPLPSYLVILWCTSCRKEKIFLFFFFSFFFTSFQDKQSVLYCLLTVTNFKNCYHKCIKLKIFAGFLLNILTLIHPEAQIIQFWESESFFSVASESFGVADKLDGFLSFQQDMFKSHLVYFPCHPWNHTLSPPHPKFFKIKPGILLQEHSLASCYAHRYWVGHYF